MRPVVVTTSGVSISNPVVLDYINTAFEVGVAAAVTDTATYTIEYSLDDPYATYATSYNVNATWLPIAAANLVAATTSQGGAITFPVRAARINQTVGAGSVTATFVQGLK